MRKFQKVTAMLLGLTMSASLFACGGNSGSDSSSKEPNTILGVELPGNLEEGEGAQYLDGAVQAFKAANTVTIEYTVSYTHSITEKSPYIAEAETENFDLDVTFKATLAKTNTGYNLAIEGNAVRSEDGESFNDPLKFYLVDGAAYTYDIETQTWDTEDITDFEEYEEFMQIYNTLMSDEADFSAIYDILGPVVEAFAFIENNEYKFNLDMKQDVTTALQTLANTDWTQTVETYINNALKEYGSQETVKSILDKIGAYGAKTVGEVYQEFNAILVQETGKDANGLKNELISKIKNIDFDMLGEYLPEETIAEALATINQIEAMSIDELIKPYNAMTIDEILPLLTETPTISPLQTLTDTIYISLQTMPLQEALYSMGMEEIMDFAKEAKYITINDLSENLSVKFQGFKFSSMNFQAKVGGKYDNTSDAAATVKIVANVAGEVSCKVNFSSEKTTLTPPSIS